MRHVRKAVKEGTQNRTNKNSIIRASISQVPSLSPWPLASLAVLELHLAMDMILTACRYGSSA